jgi:nucleotide-binding universal stress UspA family protein
MRRIVFASDFSKASRKAFATALRTAKRSKASLLIVHVLAPFLPVGPDQYVGPETWQEIDEQAKNWATRHLDALAAKARKAGVRAKLFLGSVANQIVATASCPVMTVRG